MSDQRKEHRINVTSVFGMKTRLPIVQIEIPKAGTCPVMRPGKTGPEEDTSLIGLQISPTEARSLALNLLEAAEGSLSDGFLLTFLEQEVGLTIAQLGPILIKFRGYRVSNEPEGR